jgi:competence protein ComEC
MAISCGRKLFQKKIAPSAKNDDSLVFRVKFREHSFLPSGDAEKLSEHYMLSKFDPASLHSDVLKVGHHGSKNSPIPDFLAAAQPRLAVISSGEENPYGHPGPQLIERLHQASVATLRTDTSGAIHILTDGNNLEVSCFVACPEITAQINSTKPQTPQDQQSNQQQ